MDYNKTINLPQTEFPMRAGLPNREPGMLEKWYEMDLYNEMLKKNAEKLHQGTVDIAKESERGVIDIETLTHTNRELINTLDEVQKIQTEGREKRLAAEAELGRIETELKNKLLNIEK